MPYKIANLIIDNHVKNNRVLPGTKQAIFILRPLSTSSVPCPLASSISSTIDHDRNHHPKGMRPIVPVFVNSWALEGKDVFEALRHIKQHYRRTDYSGISVTVCIYGHSDGRQIMFGQTPIKIRSMVEAAKGIAGLKLLAFLGCRTGIHDLPKPSNFVIMGSNQDICYEGIPMFVSGFFLFYRKYQQRNVSNFLYIRTAIYECSTKLIDHTMVELFK